MPKYHIGINGASACRARTRPCPLGGESGSENHFSTKEAAESFYQNSLSSKHGSVTTLKKTSSDNDLLKPIAIKIKDSASTVEKMSEMLKSIDHPLTESQEKFYRTIRNGEIPEELPRTLSAQYRGSDYSLQSSMMHSAMQDCGYYGKFTKTVARSIAHNVGDGIVLDPMAGNGFAAKALREAGVKTIASDDNSWKISSEIENMDALDSLRKHGDKISHLLISWAPYGSDIDVKLLREVRANYPHVTVINIGEGYGGCTGSEEFWDEAEPIIEKYPVPYETTFGLHDHVTFVK